MSNNKKVLGVILVGALIGYIGIMIIKSMSPTKSVTGPINEEDPFDTTELTNSYIYDHSQITK